MTRDTARWELVDWTPAKHPPIRLSERICRRSRRSHAFKCNMILRRVGATYIHNGRKP
jgi:hypothetical protein